MNADTDELVENKLVLQLLTEKFAKYGTPHLTRANVREARAFVRAVLEHRDEEGEGGALLCDLDVNGMPKIAPPRTAREADPTPGPMSHFGHRGGA